MWERKDVKARGLAAFKTNYWKCVLVALILMVIAGGSGGIGGRTGSGINVNPSGHISVEDGDEDAVFELDGDEASDVISGIKGEFQGNLPEGAGAAVVLLAVFAAILVVVLIVTVIAFLLNAFLLNPIKIGCNGFFVRNLEEPATLNELTTGFEKNYKNVVKVMFFRDLYLFLWALIPIAGIIITIVKAYEYRMIPYLLVEDPDMDKEEAFEQSKSLMYGQKWNAFVLDLSFIGWYLLSILTCGVLSVFYVGPYVQSTRAALYDTIRYGINNNDSEVYSQG